MSQGCKKVIRLKDRNNKRVDKYGIYNLYIKLPCSESHLIPNYFLTDKKDTPDYFLIYGHTWVKMLSEDFNIKRYKF